MRVNSNLEEMLNSTDIDFTAYFNPKAKETHFCLSIEEKGPPEFYWSKEIIIPYSQKDISVNQFAETLMDVWAEYDAEKEILSRRTELSGNNSEAFIDTLTKYATNLEKSLNTLMDNTAKLFGNTKKAFTLTPTERGRA